MPLWSVEDWRVQIACSYLALGIWHPVKLRGYHGQVRSKPFLSPYPTTQYLSSSVRLFLFLSKFSSLHALRSRTAYPHLILFLLKCMVLTASYLKFQLLLSGDIETNPGPNQLTLSDLQSIRSTVQPASNHWYEIGLALNIDRSRLDRIELENMRNPDDCLTAMLSVWLNNSPPPTWSVLLSALRHPLVDCGWLSTLIEDEQVLEKASTKGYHPTLSKPFREVLPLAGEWYYLGILLDIPESKLSAIRRNNHDRRDRLREILMQWLNKVDPAKMWHELAEAVEPLNPAKYQEIKQKYSLAEERYNKGCHTKPTLITAFRVVFGLASDWYYLGVFLGVPESNLSSINKSNYDYHDCIREMLEVWLKQTVQASWYDLAEAVELLDPSKACLIRQRYMGEEIPEKDDHLTLNSAFKELFSMATQWYQMGMLLNVHKTDLSNIRQTSFDRRYRFREVLKAWLKNSKPLPTWTELAEAVEPLSPSKAEEIRISYSIDEDKRDEAHQLSLIKSLRSVFPLASKWYSLGVLLNIPESVLNHIKMSEYNDVERLQEVLQEWLDQPDSEKTWHQLSEVTEQIHPLTAQNIRECYCSQQTEKDKSVILDDALKQGYVLLHITKVLISGSAGNGKTCTKYLLFNEQEKPQIRTSTPLFSDPVRALSRQIVGTDKTGCEWCKVTYHELNRMLAQSIEEGVELSETIPQVSKITQDDAKFLELKRQVLPGTDKTSVVKPSTSSKESAPSLLTGFEKPNKRNVAVTEQLSIDAHFYGSSKSLVNLPQTGFDSFDSNEVSDSERISTGLLPKKPSPASAMYSSSASRTELLRIMQSRTRSKPLHLHWIHFIDSGGQPQFHELLQVFIKNTSVVMIVLKLSESLDTYPEIAYYDRQTGQLCGKMYTSNVRNDQIIQRCIRTLSRDQRCRVMVIGTHLDRAHETEEHIEDKNNKLSLMLGPSLGNKLITRSPDEVAFPLNTLNPGQDDQKVANEIRSEIAKDKHLSVPYKVPIAWFLLEQDLQKLGMGVVSLFTCYDLGNILHMRKDAVEAALDYFHELNIVLYYPTILPNVIFASPQVIVDKVTELVEYSFYLRSRPESDSEISSLDSKLADCGEISAQTLSDPRFSKHYTPNLFLPKDLLLLFQKLFIAAPLSRETYFMPSLLQEIVKDELVEYKPKQLRVPAVLLYFPDGCVPSGVFCSLTVYLLAVCGWTRTEVVHRNCIKFYCGDIDNCIVTIIDTFECIEVYVEVDDLTHDFHCHKILSCIESGLKEANETLLQQEICYFLALKCPCNGHIEGKQSSSHPAVVNRNEWCWICTKNRKITGRLDEKMKLWLNKEMTRNKGTQTESLTSSSISLQSDVGITNLCKDSVYSPAMEDISDDLKSKEENHELEEKMLRLSLEPKSRESDSFANAKTVEALPEKVAVENTVGKPDLKMEELYGPCENTLMSSQSGFESQLHGIEVVAKTNLVVTKRATYFQWRGFGLNLNIPEGSLPLDVDQCNIDVVISFAGLYQFPDNHYLVSAIYWLRCKPACRFTKSVSIEIQHCSSGKDVSKLSFVRSHCTQKELPYQFKQIGGSFSKYSIFGSKELHTFSGYSIVQEGSSTKNYIGKVYYSNKTVTSLNIHFALIWNTEVHLNAMNKHFKEDKKAKEGPDVQVCFESDAISLDIPTEGITVSGGWKLIPLIQPIVTREEVDNFRVTNSGYNRIPSCLLEAFYESTDSETCPPRLNHVVNILGSNAGQFFRISEDFSDTGDDYFDVGRKRKRSIQFMGRTLTPYQKKKKYLHSYDNKRRMKAKGIARDYHKGTKSVMLCNKPTLRQLQVYNCSDGKSIRLMDCLAAKWEDLAIALGLEDDINCVRKNNIGDAKGACRDIFKHWLKCEDERSPITWNTLIESLRDAGEVVLAETLKRSMNDNEPQ